MSRLDFLGKKEEEVKVETPKVEKVISKAETQTPVQPEKIESRDNKEMTNFVIHSEIDALVLDRVKSQPETLDEVDKEVVVQSKEGRHQLSLPTELDDFSKKYCFTWIFKRKQAIDEACDVLHYKFTNRTYFPSLPDHLFSARGVMERGDMILMFRPKHIDDEMRRTPGIESIERLRFKEKAHEGNPNFYVPKPEDDDGNKIVAV